MSEDSLSNVSAGSLWYYCSQGQMTGPLTAGRIRQLAKQGKLFADDQVRLGAAGDWVSATEVNGLFDGVKLLTRAEQAAARTQATNDQEHQVSERGSRSSHRWDTLRGWIADTVDWGRNNLESLRVGLSWLCLVAVVISLGLLLQRRVSWDWRSSNTDPYEILSRARNEFQQLRERQADEGHWNQFATRTTPDLAGLIADLEKKAGAHDRYSQQLLWAARDAWPGMLAGGRQGPNEAERDFESHLDNAKTLKNGGQLFPGAQRIGGAAAFNPDIFMGRYGDWVVAGFIVVDGFLAIAVLRWWWHRRR